MSASARDGVRARIKDLTSRNPQGILATQYAFLLPAFPPFRACPGPGSKLHRLPCGPSSCTATNLVLFGPVSRRFLPLYKAKYGQYLDLGGKKALKGFLLTHMGDLVRVEVSRPFPAVLLPVPRCFLELSCAFGTLLFSCAWLSV
jgi:hypothetical protein